VFEQIRITLAARPPEDDCQQVDTTALPVKHPSRVRGPDQWTGPGNDLAAELARHGTHAFCGLLTRTAATIAAHTLQLTCLTQA
jgi:hypothetical protein